MSLIIYRSRQILQIHSLFVRLMILASNIFSLWTCGGQAKGSLGSEMVGSQVSSETSRNFFLMSMAIFCKEDNLALVLLINAVFLNLIQLKRYQFLNLLYGRYCISTIFDFLFNLLRRIFIIEQLFQFVCFFLKQVNIIVNLLVESLFVNY